MTIPMTHLVHHLFASDFWLKAREILARLPRLTDEEKEDTLGQHSSVFLPTKWGPLSSRYKWSDMGVPINGRN